MKRLSKLAASGFSPSSLTTYIYDPLTFYINKILNIWEQDELEDTIELNTLGTIIHNTFETLYLPYCNTVLTVDMLTQMLTDAPKVLLSQFSQVYKKGQLTEGMNLISLEVAKSYVKQFLEQEKVEIENGNRIEILQVEAELELDEYFPELGFNVRLKGKVDRVDRYNGALRIIDYKTGAVAPGDLAIKDWSALISDYKKYSKCFQVLMYAYLMHRTSAFELPVQSGIISLKRLQSGYMAFKEEKQHGVTEAVLSAFREQLGLLLKTIYDPDIPFKENEDTYDRRY